MSEDLTLECFVEPNAELRLRPAPHRRDWMDASNVGFAYRCLPLAIANAHGWEALNPRRFEAVWTGKKTPDAVKIRSRGDRPPLAVSHFGEGVLTFHIPGLFRTPPGYDLFATGPMNRPKPRIQALTGVIETDWSPFSFTMNWIFTEPNAPVAFEEDEPIAAFFPLKRGVVETFEPVLRNPEEAPDLWEAHMDWRQSRSKFNADLKKEGSEARRMKWQKGYTGGPPEPVDPPHRTRLRLREFKR